MEEIRIWLEENNLLFLQQVVSFLAILGIAWIFIRVTRVGLKRYFKKSDRLNDILERLLLSVYSKAMWLIAFMVALPELGVDVGPLIAGAGVGGFIIGFAFQESLGNFAAGLMISMNQPFQVGDFVEAGGTSGAIRNINFMSTTMLTGDNKRVVVPNSKIWGDNITNYSAMDTRRIDMTVGIGYSSHIGKAIEVIQSVINENQQVLRDPAPLIEVSELADSSVVLAVRPWVNTPDYWSTYFSLNRAFKESLDRAGIEIPFPQLDVHHHGIPNQ